MRGNAETKFTSDKRKEKAREEGTVRETIALSKGRRSNGLVTVKMVKSMFMNKNIASSSVVLAFLFFIIHLALAQVDVPSDSAPELLYSIEGRVYPPDSHLLSNWQAQTRVLINGGEHTGFLKEDGTFVVNNVPSGSYVVEVANPNFAYEPVRVEINSKGKYRARKVNYIQTSQVIQVSYPLKLKPLARFRYFQVREQWRITDFLFSPMVLMMVLPLLLIMVLPKMMNDPETRKEMEQLNNLTKYDMPEMSEVLTSFFAGGEKQKARAVKASKKRQ